MSLGAHLVASQDQQLVSSAPCQRSEASPTDYSSQNFTSIFLKPVPCLGWLKAVCVRAQHRVYASLFALVKQQNWGAWFFFFCSC